ncbi:MAG: ATP-binding cassette domain-containing protein [Chloroflexi bacterium]|nr:ATP-binding cassette domain-containing protein [Chloroflexota bacterium]
MEDNQTDDVIRVENLVKRYDDLKAVNGVSFEVHRGEIFGILGPNGAGKTTTVEILEGMRVADSGTAMINGIDVSRDPRAVKSIIGVQLQSVQFFDQLKLHELVSLFGSLYSRKVNARELLARVDLTEKSDSLYKTLSGGQKQRLSVAVALVNDPVVLFLDEPTTGLDPQARRHMWELISSIRDGGATIVLTTHYMEEAEELCDRVAIMDSGEIVRLGSPSELIEELLATGFSKSRTVHPADLEDVFIHLTGHGLREDS